MNSAISDFASRYRDAIFQGGLPGARELLAEEDDKLGHPGPDNTSPAAVALFLHQADFSARIGQPQKGLALLEKCVKACPPVKNLAKRHNSGPAVAFLALMAMTGDINTGIQHFDDAEKAYSTGLQVHSTHPVLSTKCAQLLLEANKPVPRMLLSNFSRMDGAGVIGTYTQAMVDAISGDPNMGVTRAETCTREDPTNPFYWSTLAKAHVKCGRLDEALSALSSCLRVYPDWAPALLIHSQILTLKGLTIGSALSSGAACHFTSRNVNATAQSAISFICDASQGPWAMDVFRDHLLQLPLTEGSSWALTVVASKLFVAEEFDEALEVARFVATNSSDGKSIIYSESIVGEILAKNKETWDEAEKHLLRAVDIDDSETADSPRIPLSAMYKESGRLGDCAILHEDLYRVKPTPSHLFNYLLSLEYLAEYEDAVTLCRDFVSETPLRESSSYETFAIHLLYYKLLFAGPVGDEWYTSLPGDITKLLSLIPPSIKLRLMTESASHWAYIYFLDHLFQKSGLPKAFAALFEEAPAAPSAPLAKRRPRDTMRFPNGRGRKAQAWPTPKKIVQQSNYKYPLTPMYVVGDSHCLSVAWRPVQLRGQRRLCIPRVVNGLKTWHMRPGTEFLTNAALHVMLRSFDPVEREVMLSVGEIDCRLGIAKAYRAGKYPSLPVAVIETAKEYVATLRYFSKAYEGLKFLVLPVAPGASEGRMERRMVTAMFNHVLRCLLYSTRGVPADTVSSFGPRLPRSVAVLLDYERDLYEFPEGDPITFTGLLSSSDSESAPDSASESKTSAPSGGAGVSSGGAGGPSPSAGGSSAPAPSEADAALALKLWGTALSVLPVKEGYLCDEIHLSAAVIDLMNAELAHLT